MDDGKDLWIGTFENGIDVMDIKTGVVKKHFISGPGQHQLQSNFALTFLKTSAGKILIGTSNGLYYYNPTSEGFDRPAEVPGDHFVTSLIEDHNHVVWVGTGGSGVFWFDPASGKNGQFLRQYNNSNSLSNNNVNDLYEDHLHNIWFATEGGGACRLSADRKAFTTFTTANKLPGNFIFSILEDDANTIWMSTSKGLASFRNGKGEAKVYTTANGLLNDQFNYHSGFKDSEGRLYFGSVRGMVSFKPESFIPRRIAPPVYITGFQVYNKDVEVDSNGVLPRSIIMTDEIVLPHDMSSISIDFAALSYISPSKIEYRYKLQGLDKNWINIPTNRKVYFNLTPGTYTFTLMASLNGVFSPNKAVLTIKILPPFWATTTAYAL
jgi:ligand-binding sensor domain-containing protein